MFLGPVFDVNMGMVVSTSGSSGCCVIWSHTMMVEKNVDVNNLRIVADRPALW